MKHSIFHVALLLFASGWCALVYQTVWLREFRLIFGASTAATAAVLGLFMGGLGVGSALLGPRGDRSRRPLALYGKLELGIALTAAISPFLLMLVQLIYSWIGGIPTVGLFFGTLLRLTFAAVVIGAPAFLMGGTLPAAVRAVVSRGDVGRRGLSFLYGVNTLGAVTGVALSTFFLLEALGNRQTLWFAGALNLLVAWIAWRMDREEVLPENEPVNEVRQAAMPAAFVLPAAGIAGFSFFLMELVWYRMLSPVLGGSTFTFGIILGVALLGIGLGGVAHGLFFAGRQATAGAFAITCALEALCVAIPYALGDRLATLAGLLRSLHAIGFYGNVLGWTLTTSIVVLPAAFVAGVQFPMLISLLGRGSESVARQTGQAYAWNTVGALAGSLAGGFGLLPLLSAPGAWQMVVGLLALLALAALWAGWMAKGAPRPSKRRTAAAAILISAALLALLFQGPTDFWRHTPIGAGRVPLIGKTANEIEAARRRANASVIWQAEGIESSVALDSDSGLAFIVNGKNDGNAVIDRGTQIMSGLLPALLQGDPKSACVVGLGTGSTGGWLAQIPSMERVLVIELEPAMQEVAERVAPVNRNALEQPNLEVVYQDGREVLTTIDEQFDLIISEPSNPYRAGIASLFTKEYYEACRDLLTEKGVFAQWLQAYEVDAATIRTVYRTLGEVFPKVETFNTQRGDLLLIGYQNREPLDFERMDALARTEPFRTALRLTWMVEGGLGILSRFIIGDEFVRAIQQAGVDEMNTDNRTVLEFAFAKTVGDHSRFALPEMIALAKQRGYDRPQVEGDIDWKRVDRLATTALGVNGFPMDPYPGATDAVRKALRVHQYYYSSNWTALLAQVREGRWKPESLLDHLMIGEALTKTKNPEAAEYVQALSEALPREARYLRALAAAQRNANEMAARDLETLFTELQTSPWLWEPILGKALKLADDLAAKDPQLNRRLLASLDQPFAAYAANYQRWKTTIRLANRLPDGERLPALRQIMEEREPWGVWEKDYLAMRAALYKEMNDPRADKALRDFKEFVANEPKPIGAALPERPTSTP